MLGDRSAPYDIKDLEKGRLIVSVAKVTTRVLPHRMQGKRMLEHEVQIAVTAAYAATSGTRALLRAAVAEVEGLLVTLPGKIARSWSPAGLTEIGGLDLVKGGIAADLSTGFTAIVVTLEGAPTVTLHGV